jgi:O-antigen ligase
METIQTYEEDDERSAISRFHFWHVAVLMAQSNPLFGVGHNAYNFAYNTYDFSRGLYGARRSVHSAHFGILAELGFPGLLLYTLNLFAAWRSCARTCRLLRQIDFSPELYHTAQALQVGLTAYLVGSSFLPFQYNEMFWHFLGFTIIVENLAEQHVRAALNSEEMIDVTPALATMTDEKV